MNLTLIMPGLLEVLPADPASRFQRLEKWVARAIPDNKPNHCYEQALLDIIGCGWLDNADIPAAQCTWITDFDESAPNFCARADPIHLKTDKDHARLIPAESLNIEAEETQELVAALNLHFEQDGLRFSVGQKGRWYISGVQASLPNTPPTSQVAGRNVATFQPSSPETARWRQIAIEAQMLLHSHPVNQQRESRGVPPVNSLWCWGGGKFAMSESPTECKVYSNAAFAVGLGKLSGMRVYPLEEAMVLQKVLSSQSNRNAQSSMVILDTRLLEGILCGDTAEQRAVLSASLAQVFADAEKMLMRGSLSRIRLDPCDGSQFNLSRRGLMCFWKKAKPLVPA